MNDLILFVFDLLEIVVSCVVLVGVCGGFCFVVFILRLGFTKEGKRFVKWLYDEFGI